MMSRESNFIHNATTPRRRYRRARRRRARAQHGELEHRRPTRRTPTSHARHMLARLLPLQHSHHTLLFHRTVQTAVLTGFYDHSLKPDVRSRPRQSPFAAPARRPPPRAHRRCSAPLRPAWTLPVPRAPTHPTLRPASRSSRRGGRARLARGSAGVGRHAAATRCATRPPATARAARPP